MKPLSDEILVAYADDELAPAERAAVERRLAHDADARDRLAAFTSTGQWLARAYDDTLRAAPPDDLVRALRAAGSGADATARTPVATPRRSLWQRLRAADWSLVGPGMGGIGVGLAAGVALMLALPGQEPGGLDESRLVATALETAASGEPHLVGLPDGRLEITPIGTVRTAEGGICREYTEIRDIGGAPAEVVHGLACRDAAPGAAAGWHVVARVDLTPPPSAERAGFALASGDPQAVFEALLETLGAIEVLGPEEERERLAEGWR